MPIIMKQSRQNKKPHERLAYLDQSVRKMFKQYGNNSSPIDTSEPMVFDQHEINLRLSALSPTLGLENRISSKKNIVLSQGQYGHIFPHPSISLKCSLCEQTCPSNAPTEHMMVLFNSPSSLFPLCSLCSKSLGKIN